jgi:hypothetical protein
MQKMVVGGLGVAIPTSTNVSLVPVTIAGQSNGALTVDATKRKTKIVHGFVIIQESSNRVKVALGYRELLHVTADIQPELILVILQSGLTF